MRAVAMLLCLCACFSSIAIAEPFYFVIDNSGSMARHRASAEQEIVQTVDDLPLETPISVTYFRGRDDTDCERDVSVPEPAAKPRPIELKPEEPANGSTLLMKAIDAAYAATGAGAGSTILLYTDGTFAENGCDTPEQVCMRLAELRQARPEVSFQFRAPPTVRSLGIPAFRCADIPEILETPIFPVSAVSAGDPLLTDGASPTDTGLLPTRCGRFSWLWIFAWLSVAIAFVNMLNLYLSSRLLFSRRITNLAAKTPNSKVEHNKPNTEHQSRGDLRRIFEGVFWGLVFAGSSTAIGLNWAETTSTLCWLWQLMNTPFGSLLSSTAIASYLGWWFYRFWNDSQDRRDAEWTAKLAEHKDAIASQRRSDMQGSMSTMLARLRDELDDLTNGEKERNWSGLLEPLSVEAAQADDVAKHIAAIREAVYLLLPPLDQIEKLRDYDSLSFKKMEKLISRLKKDGQLNSDQAQDLSAVFKMWQQVSENPSTHNVALFEKILSFNKHTLCFI